MEERISMSFLKVGGHREELGNNNKNNNNDNNNNNNTFVIYKIKVNFLTKKRNCEWAESRKSVEIIGTFVKKTMVVIREYEFGWIQPSPVFLENTK